MKRSPINRISDRRKKKLKKEKELSQVLLFRSGGFCENCGKLPDFRGLKKHELTFRSHGGDPLDPANCKMLCGSCHSAAHGVHEVG